jgi:streptomycin 6-kinase
VVKGQEMIQRVTAELLFLTKSQHQVEGAFLLNVVVREGAPILELLASEDKALLVGRNTLLILDLLLHVVDGISRLNLEGDGFAGEGLDENLHATTETEDEVKSRLLLDVVVGESATIFELLAGEDEALLVRRNALLVLDLLLHVVDGVSRFDLKGDGLACQRLDKDLHTTTETKDEVKGALLLNVVVGEGATIFKLLASENQALLVGRYSLLILDLLLDIVDGISRLNFEGDGFAGEGLYEDLHTTSETKDEVKSALLLNVVVGESATVFELLAGEDESLLIRRNALLILDLDTVRNTSGAHSKYLLFNVVDGISRLDLESDGLAGECLDEDLHCRCVLFLFSASEVLSGCPACSWRHMIGRNAARYTVFSFLDVCSQETFDEFSVRVCQAA